MKTSLTKNISVINPDNQNLTFPDAQTKSYNLYMSVLLILLNQGVDISKGSRPRILASAWARHDKVLSSFLLSLEETFSLPAILTALNLLDAGRKLRSVEKKIARLEKQVKISPKLESSNFSGNCKTKKNWTT